MLALRGLLAFDKFHRFCAQCFYIGLRLVRERRLQLFRLLYADQICREPLPGARRARLLTPGDIEQGRVLAFLRVLAERLLDDLSIESIRRERRVLLSQLGPHLFHLGLGFPRRQLVEYCHLDDLVVLYRASSRRGTPRGLG